MQSRFCAALAFATLLVAAGCGGPPVKTEPLAPTEIERIAAKLDESIELLSALRAGGTGSLSTQDHRTEFVLAALYDRPGWLRADMRPSSPAAPSGFAAYVLVENACARMFIPSSLLEVSDCIDPLPFADPALLLFGLISGDDIRMLESPIAELRGDDLVLAGRRGELRLEFTVESDAYRLTNFSLRAPGDVWFTGEYDGHGWKQSLPLPRTTILKFGRKGRTQARLRFEFDRLRSSDHVDRTAHDVVSPPGTTVSTWGDLALWR